MVVEFRVRFLVWELAGAVTLGVVHAQKDGIAPKRIHANMGFRLSLSGAELTMHALVTRSIAEASRSK